eukprot:XP_011660608.1 PREDICTED: L-rhamnose-binding lectin CSL3-like [Strongylocentrotus purpuratus]
MDLSTTSSKFVLFICLLVGIGPMLAKSQIVTTILLCEGDIRLIDGMGGKIQVLSALYGRIDPSLCLSTTTTTTTTDSTTTEIPIKKNADPVAGGVLPQTIPPEPTIAAPTTAAVASIPCKSTATASLITDICNGRCQCIMAASNSLFGDPCPGLTEYVTMTYTIIE